MAAVKLEPTAAECLETDALVGRLLEVAASASDPNLGVAALVSATLDFLQAKHRVSRLQCYAVLQDMLGAMQDATPLDG